LVYFMESLLNTVIVAHKNGKIKGKMKENHLTKYNVCGNIVLNTKCNGGMSKWHLKLLQIHLQI